MEKKHIEFQCKATSIDPKERLVYGRVSVSDIIDLDGDIIELEEFKKMYKNFMRKYNAKEATIDGNHRVKDVCDLYETSKGFYMDYPSWDVCVYVKNDQAWEDGLMNGFGGFSIGGLWERHFDEKIGAHRLKNVDLDEFSLLYGKSNGAPRRPANQLSTIAGVKEDMNERNLINQIWGRIQTTIENALKSLNEGDTMDEKKLKELVEGMIKSALDTFKEELAKAKKELAPEDLDVIKQMISDAISAAMSGEGMGEPAKAAKAANDAVTELKKTVDALVKTIETQTKQIADLLEASAKSQHKKGGEGGDDGDKKESAISTYAKSVKIKE